MSYAIFVKGCITNLNNNPEKKKSFQSFFDLIIENFELILLDFEMVRALFNLDFYNNHIIRIF